MVGVAGHVGTLVSPYLLADRMVLHLDQMAAGRGQLDYNTFLRRMDAYGREVPVIVEAAEVPDRERVSACLHERARRNGIEILEASAR